MPALQSVPRTPKGARTREEILAEAVDLASAEGLEALTIGRLASALGLSKSGLFAHFGSKEELQLATVESAAAIFRGEVIDPVADVPGGMARLEALYESWRCYVGRSVFRGGCFFAAASAEFDGRPGAVRELIAKLTKYWLDLLETEACHAKERKEFRNDVDCAQLAFELHAFVQEANWAYQLLRLEQSFERARVAGRARLEQSATLKGLQALNVKRIAKPSALKK